MEQNQVEVEITAATVVTSQYGTLAQGDKLRTSREFAKHLVDDAKAAKYTEARKASADDGDDDGTNAAGTGAAAAGDAGTADNADARASAAAGRQSNDPERQGSTAAKTPGRGSKS